MTLYTDKQIAQSKTVADKLFRIATDKGFVEGGWESPRVTKAELKKALRNTELNEYDLKLGFLPNIRIMDAPGYSGQFTILRPRRE